MALISLAPLVPQGKWKFVKLPSNIKSPVFHRPLEARFKVEADAVSFFKTQIGDQQVWNHREARSFGFFIEYLRRLQLDSMDAIDADFVNTLRHNIIKTYYEGCLNNQLLYMVSSTIDEFLTAKTDNSYTPLFYDDEIYDLTQERKKLSVFNDDAFEDTLADLRYCKLHTEAALLEVVRYLGLTLKEAMFLNASLSIDYARKNEHIVVRNQDQKTVRRVNIWNVDQMVALTRLATNRLINDPQETYRDKRYAYLFAPVSQIYKHLSNNSLSLFALRKAYFEEQFYLNVDTSLKDGLITARIFTVSAAMGHSFCFDEYCLMKTDIDLRKAAAAGSILEQHPKKFMVPQPIWDYVIKHHRESAPADSYIDA